MTSASLLLRDYSASLNNGEQPNSNPFSGDAMAPLFLRGLALSLSRQNHFGHYEIFSESFRNHFCCPALVALFQNHFESHFEIICPWWLPYGAIISKSFSKVISKSFRSHFEIIFAALPLWRPPSLPSPLSRPPWSGEYFGRRTCGRIIQKPKQGFCWWLIHTKNPSRGESNSALKDAGMKDEQEDRFSIFRFLVKKLDFVLIFGFLVEKLEITRELLSGGHFPPCLMGGASVAKTTSCQKMEINFLNF